MNTIYVVQAGEAGPVRIALTTGVTLARLAAGNPEPLIIRRIYEGDREQLRRLHERHALHHLRADWFAADVLRVLDTDELVEIHFDRDAQARRLAEQAAADRAEHAVLVLAGSLRSGS